MKNRVIWIMFMVVALASVNALAVWDPNEPNLQFILSFENNNDACTFAKVPTSVDASGWLLGKHSSGVESNSIDHAIYEISDACFPIGGGSIFGLGHDANFQPIHDGWATNGVKYGPNDIKVRIPYNRSYNNVTSGSTIFDLGANGETLGNFPVRTWAFWIWTMHKDNDYTQIYPTGSIIRLQAALSTYEDPNYFWEIGLNNGQVQFQQKSGTAAASTLLTAATTQSLDAMDLTPNQWHHVAVSIDRNTRTGTKMYVDGLQRDVTVTDYRTQAASPISVYSVLDEDYTNPLMIGSGKKKFDGMLDDIRLYKRALTSLEVSILKQTNDTNHPVALEPIPGSSDVKIDTALTWVPATTVAAQNVYFGPNSLALPLITNDHSAGLNTVTNSELNGTDLLDLATTYYWEVDSNYATTNVDGPIWSFTTETGKARNPTPAINQDYVSGTGNRIRLMWGESATPPANYSVYLSTDRSLVEANDPSVRILDANIPTDVNTMVRDVNDINTVITAKGTEIFWRVISNYGTPVTGDTWNFRTRPYEIIFNVTKGKQRYSDHDVNGLAMIVKDANWTQVQIGTVDADANIAVFNFASGFNYNRTYDIVVIPAYIADDIHTDLVPSYDVNTPRPLGLHVTGNFYFDGRINISGNDVTLASEDGQRARSGGAPGPKRNCGEASVFNDHGILIIPVTNYYTAYSSPTYASGTHGRTTGQASLSGKNVYDPTPLCKSIFGPGTPANPPYKGGAGASYGGLGGNCGRGYYFGVETTIGRTYGDTPVPIPFGGSAGGWSGSGPGASGGGGIEIIATGDVNLDVHSAIMADGGSQIVAPLAYGTGGGSGGSVKIIAGGKFTNKGSISATGGIGSDATQANNGGGGGGGGRVAINYATAGSTQGTITVAGGAHGWYADSLNNNIPDNLAENGKAGTILFTTASAKVASTPTPVDGDKKAYIGTPDPATTFQLSWYSGYGATNDRVWFGTSSGSLAPIGSKVTATRKQHSITQSVSRNKTYFWQVKSDTNSIASPIWSFSTVGWQCPIGISGGIHHPIITERGGTLAAPRRSDPNWGIAGPEWDHNGDCVLNAEDYAYFAKDWLNVEFGPPDQNFGIPVMGLTTLRRFANEWLECIARTNSGCTTPLAW